MADTLILDLVIEAMGQVAKEGRDMFMLKYYRELSAIDQTKTEIHTCGTAACICGYAALHKPLQEAMEYTPQKHVHPSQLPDLLWNRVANEIGVEAADSCFHAYADERADLASIVPWMRDLMNHPHLNINNPTAEQALDYLKEVRKAFGEHDARSPKP